MTAVQRSCTPEATLTRHRKHTDQSARERDMLCDPKPAAPSAHSPSENSKPKTRPECKPKKAVFWQEVFSAGTMMVPSIYCHNVVAELAFVARKPLGLWVMTWATYTHCLASVAYHLRCAFGSRPDFDHLRSPFRAADMAFIHVCCFCYGWAVSGGWLLFNTASLLANVACVASLVGRQATGVPTSKADSYRAIGCILIYTFAMVLRMDLANYAGTMLCYGIGGLFWTRNASLASWGHGSTHCFAIRLGGWRSREPRTSRDCDQATR
eukprot:TRINITY_DN9498_c0_g1_i2.p1 TRINITY_DN9498_c0_g1~~TRINITY_DN9498_c0_g1_i2.p1  ORF type:complete len:267 (-),score=19.96 TRINITY_DN9498_c0_g1_i2:149-949(-)